MLGGLSLPRLFFFFFSFQHFSLGVCDYGTCDDNGNDGIWEKLDLMEPEVCTNTTNIRTEQHATWYGALQWDGYLAGSNMRRLSSLNNNCICTREHRLTKGRRLHTYSGMYVLWVNGMCAFAREHDDR